MNGDSTEINDTAYRHLKPTIDATFRPGEHVGIVGGEIVAHAETFPQLLARLDQIELRPERRLIVQAGQTYPKRVVIRSVRLVGLVGETRLQHRHGQSPR